MEGYWLSALLIGLLGSLHCVGMCGNISAVLTFSLPQPMRDSTPRLLGFVGLYNAGRLLSYTLAGSLAGAFGGQLIGQLRGDQGFLWLRLMSTLLMIAVGLYLAGWFPRYAHIERIGLPLWRRLEPLGRRMLPVGHPLQALLYGMIWGWLPCGLVYTALLLALSQGQALQGGLYMLAFGIGTLPSVMSTGVFAGRLLAHARDPRIRRYAGMILIVFALLGWIFNWGPDELGHHR